MLRLLKQRHKQEGAPLHQEIGLLRFLTDRVFTCTNGSLGMLLRFSGIEPEGRLPEDLEADARRFERAFKCFDERFRVYQYVIKRSHPEIPHEDVYPSEESRRVSERRLQELRDRAEKLHGIETYLVVLLESASFQRWFGWSDLKAALESKEAQERSIQTLEATIHAFQSSISDLLSTNVPEERESTVFFRSLLNPDRLHAHSFSFRPGDWLDYAVADCSLRDLGDVLRIGSHFAVAGTIKLSPVDPKPAAITRALMAVPCDFIACMEWHPRSVLHMRKRIKSSQKTYLAQMVSWVSVALQGMTVSKDEMPRKSDLEERNKQLDQCLKALEGGAVFGDWSCVIVLLSEEPNRARTAFSGLIKVYGQADASIVGEDLNLQSAFFAILPGNSHRNHSYSYLVNGDYANLSYIWSSCTGNPRNAHLGREYLCLYETTDQQPFYYNGHVGGVFGVLKMGAPESGKSFDTNYELAHLQKYDPVTLILDIGGSYRDLTQQFGGTYYEVGSHGQSERMNPFALDPTKENFAFLFEFLRLLLGSTVGLTAEEKAAEDRVLYQAIESIYALEPEDRRLKHLSLPKGLRLRLAKWIEGGQYGHIFDNAQDTIRFQHFQTFDFQAVHKQTELLTAVCFYLTQRFDAVIFDPAQAERLKMFAADECWYWMLNSDMSGYMLNKLKTGRKNNLCNLFITQSGLDSERSEFGELLNEACPTKKFFANPDIRPKTYERLFGLNPLQAERIAQLRPRKELAIYQSHPERPASKIFKVVELNIGDAGDRLTYSNDPKSNAIKLRRAANAAAF